MKVKGESEKVGLKLSFRKLRLTSDSITSWQIDGETMEMVTDFIFLGSKITVDGECSHEIKTLAPWKKSYDQPRQHIKKQRLHFSDKGPYSQCYGFSRCHVWMWELDPKEVWVSKNWCFQTVVLEKTLEKSNQSILKEINPEYSLEGLMPKLKLQYFGHLIRRANSLENTLMLGKIEGRKRRGAAEYEMAGWHHWLHGHELEQPPGVGEGQGSLACCSPWGRRVRHNWATEQQQNI